MEPEPIEPTKTVKQVRSKQVKEVAPKIQKLTASNLQKLERQAPGPADLNPNPGFCSKHVSIAPLPKTKSKLEKEFN